MTNEEPAAVVRSFLDCQQARNWDGARALISESAEIVFSHTGECFSGRSFMDMNVAFPEGWQIEILDVIGINDRVATNIRVTQDGSVYCCGGFYTVHNGKIVEGVEHWATANSETPPDWRAKYTIQ
jgi:SnoaL-like domain